LPQAKNIVWRDTALTWLTYQTLKLLPLFRRMPDWMARALGRVTGAAAYMVWKRPRRVAIENLAHAYPDWSEQQIRRLAYSAFQKWGGFFIQFLRLHSFTDEDWETRVIVEGSEHVYRALERGRGVIIATGHLGCFEAGAAYIGHLKMPVSVIARYAKTPAMTALVTGLRESGGYQVLVDDTRGFKAMRLLRANEIVCILIDQDSGSNGVFVDYFGRPASAPPGPAILAGRSGAAIVPGWVVEDPQGKLRFIVEPEVPNPGPRPTPDQVQVTMQEMTSRLEAVVRRYPDQWLWMHRRWKTPKSTDSSR